jgi:NAD(P)H dehydrogenase (quinone)
VARRDRSSNTPRRVVVVLAHPSAGSFNHSVFATAVEALAEAGHAVTPIDLYAINYPAVMTADDRRAYHGPDPIICPITLDHAAAVRAADTLVFVYPTWWTSMPAMLKGWLEKVMAPGTAFVFDDSSGKVKPGLRQVKRIIGISTYGSSRLVVKAANDNGRRTLLRALRMCTGWRTRSTWLALYDVPSTSDGERAGFLAGVRRTMAEL